LLGRKTLVGTLTGAIGLLIAATALAGVINGTNGPNTINGTPQADNIHGLGGDDTIRGLRCTGRTRVGRSPRIPTAS
jgi:hypothetical protein